ncbi:MAG: redoxin domain-containing protein [bacterium]|nr:redoxin domain-containing protein [bacterium]
MKPLHRMACRRSAYLALAVGLTVLLVPVLAQAAGDGTATPLGGIVVDEADKPVAGAEVLLLTTPVPGTWALEEATRTTTEADGRFSMDMPADMPQHLVILVATSPKHGCAFESPVFLTQAGKGLEEFRFVMPARGSVAGRVVDEAEKPVANVRVTAMILIGDFGDAKTLPYMMPCEAVAVATSGPDGAFVLDGLPAEATVGLVGKQPGFATAVVGLPDTFSRTMKSNIAVGATDAIVTMEKGATVSGTVTRAATGAKVADAEVKITVQQQRTTLRSLLSVPGSGETDAEGRFSISGLLDGAYIVEASTDDLPATSVPFTVEEGKDVDGVAVALAKGVRLVCTFVKKDTDEPHTDVHMMVVSTTTNTAAAQGVKVKPDGTFEAILAPGTYRLHPQVQNGTLQGSDQGRQIELKAGEDMTDLVYEISPPLLFKGKVVDPDGKPLAGATVTRSWGRTTSATSGDDGTFELAMENQRMGEHEHVLLKGSHGETLRGTYYGPMTSIEDASGTVELKPLAKAHGRITDAEGKPLAKAKVAAWAKFDRMSTTDVRMEADDEGKYAFSNLMVGQLYSVRASAEGYGVMHSAEFTLEEGGDHAVEDVALAVADQVIEGVVVDNEGEPIADAQVSASSEQTEHSWAKTDAKGRFKLEKLVDEEIRLYVHVQTSDGTQYANMNVMAGETEVELVVAERQTSRSQEDRRKQMVVGKDAKALDVAAWAQGDAVTLESLKGKTVALVFADSDSAKSTKALKTLSELKFKRKQVLVVVFEAEADQDVVKKHLKEAGLKCPAAIDKPEGEGKRGVTHAAYKVTRPPSIFVIGPDGKVEYQKLPVEALVQALQE